MHSGLQFYTKISAYWSSSYRPSLRLLPSRAQANSLTYQLRLSQPSEMDAPCISLLKSLQHSRSSSYLFPRSTSLPIWPSLSAFPPQENMEKRSFCPVDTGPRIASTSASWMTAPLPEHRAFRFSWEQRSSMSSWPEVTLEDFCTRSLQSFHMSQWQIGKVNWTEELTRLYHMTGIYLILRTDRRWHTARRRTA